MLAVKRCRTDHTSSKDESCKVAGGEPIESSGVLCQPANQGSWSAPTKQVASDLSKSVVSIALTDGYVVLFACSGIPLERELNTIKFVTSASLVRAFKDKTQDHGFVKIVVRCESNDVEGFLDKYDLDHEIAFVKTTARLDVKAVHLNHEVTCLHDTKVMSVGREPSGKLIATSGILTSCGYEDHHSTMFSSCVNPQDLEGGPLFDFDGNLLGMNFLSDMERTFFIPTYIILERWHHLQTSESRSAFLKLLNKMREDRDTARPEDIVSNGHFRDLETLSYPKLPEPSYEGEMILVNTFEETFGDAYGEGVWRSLSRRVSSNISRNVVALASFIGKRRLFACTGFFIEWNGCSTILTSASLIRNSYDPNKIVDNVKIDVLLPNKQHSEGTLQHYNLHYNVALVSVENFCCLRPANIQHKCVEPIKSMVAVGRIFNSGVLMAVEARLTCSSGTLDCTRLVYTDCKITKAGIGGPLVDSDGRFVGMNFYDQRVGTPALMRFDILEVLNNFQSVVNGRSDTCHSGTVPLIIDGDVATSKPNRWPVPSPCWRRRDDPGPIDADIPPPGRKYVYEGGSICLLRKTKGKNMF